MLSNTKLLNSNMSGNCLCLLPGIYNCTEICYLFQANLHAIVSGLGRSPGEGNGNPYQYSCLENSMDRGAWWAAVHGVAKSQILHFSSKNVLTFNLLVLLLDLQRRDKMQKQKKKNTSQFINLVFTCSLFLAKFDLPIFFHLEYYNFLPGIHPLKS